MFTNELKKPKKNESMVPIDGSKYLNTTLKQIVREAGFVNLVFFFFFLNIIISEIIEINVSQKLTHWKLVFIVLCKSKKLLPPSIAFKLFGRADMLIERLYYYTKHNAM